MFFKNNEYMEDFNTKVASFLPGFVIPLTMTTNDNEQITPFNPKWKVHVFWVITNEYCLRHDKTIKNLTTEQKEVLRTFVKDLKELCKKVAESNATI